MPPGPERVSAGLVLTGLGIVTALALAAQPRAPAPPPPPPPPPPGPHLQIIQNYADTIIDATDKYGPAQSPALACALSRQTGQLLSSRPPDVPGIRNQDRAVFGTNPQHDINLYQTLYGLTQVLGDARYAATADASLDWFLRNTQSPVTGLLCWGEHLSWNFRTEQAISGSGYAQAWPRLIHEFYRPWPFWPRWWGLAPDACHRFALGLWQHQIADQITGDFNRHTGYDTHFPETGVQLPRHGSFYIDTWAHAYQQTADPVYLNAINVLVGSYEQRQQLNWGLFVPPGTLPDQTNPSSHPVIRWAWSPWQTLAYSIMLHRAVPKLPAVLASRLLAAATDQDSAFHAHFDAQIARFAQIDLALGMFDGGYGGEGLNHANIGLFCLERYRQAGDSRFLDRAQSIAQQYMQASPIPGDLLFPGTLGDVIMLLHGVYQTRGGTELLDRARYFADLAITAFWDTSSSLPKVTNHHIWYEAITRADTLAMAILALNASTFQPVFTDL